MTGHVRRQEHLGLSVFLSLEDEPITKLTHSTHPRKSPNIEGKQGGKFFFPRLFFPGFTYCISLLLSNIPTCCTSLTMRHDSHGFLEFLTCSRKKERWNKGKTEEDWLQQAEQPSRIEVNNSKTQLGRSLAAERGKEVEERSLPSFRAEMSLMAKIWENAESLPHSSSAQIANLPFFHQRKP